MKSVIRILFALALMFSAPALARSDRLELLQRQLVHLQQVRARAIQAHDMWLANLSAGKRYPGLPATATTMYRGREDWSTSLREVWAISELVYPGDAGPALMTSPPADLSEPERRAHREAAIPEIDALIKRMTDEISALKPAQ
jgi:hypothetical protein